MKQIIFILALSCTSSVLAKAPIIKGAKGQFVKIEAGDYWHLVINDNGHERSFWVYGCKPLDCVQMKDKPALYKGKNLLVKYQTEKVFVKEAGYEVVQDQTVSVSFAK